MGHRCALRNSSLYNFVRLQTKQVDGLPEQKDEAGCGGTRGKLPGAYLYARRCLGPVSRRVCRLGANT